MTNPPAVTGDPSNAQEAHLRDYWKVVWHARWTVLAIAVLVVGISAVWTFTRTPIYEATASVEIQPKARNVSVSQDVSGLGAGGYGWFAEEKYHNTQVEIIRSRDISARVIERLGLASHPRFAEASDPVEAFRRSIVVVPRRDTGIIEITLRGADREEITHWVNEVAEAYVERNIATARENADDMIELMNSQMEEMKREAMEAERGVVAVQQEEGLGHVENRLETTRQQLLALYEELTKVRVERNRLEETLRQAAEIQASGEPLLTLPELAKDDTLRELYRSRFDLEKQREAAEVDLLPGHPQYESTLSELAINDERIKERVGVILSQIQNAFDNVYSRERYIEDQIRGAESTAFQISQATSRYNIVKIGADAETRVLEVFGRAFNEVILGQQLLTNNVRILDKANVPLWPIAPRKKMNVMLGGLLGACLGVAAAFFLDYLDNTFRTPEDIEKYLGLSVLGVIPKIGKSVGRVNILEDDNRVLLEAYQSLRTSIIFSSKNRTRKVILTTSTGPQEGKSSTVANLGRVLAQAGDRAIVIDCDLRRPTQHEHHGVPREPGLTNYLTAPLDDRDWSRYVQTAPGGKLELLTCGPIPPSPTELLGSERFATLIAELREQYDWILIDSPPASSLADATLLAQAADMVVAVVQHNKTDRDRVRKAVQRVRAADATLAGAVLNNVDISRAYDKDYYYASYYYTADEAAGGKSGRRSGNDSKRSVG